jgi:hypothetical protein
VAARIFTAFDYEHDEYLRNVLVGQSRRKNSPFEICDWSLSERSMSDWENKLRERIRKCEQVIVICGEHTHRAGGVSYELAIAQREHLPYFLLRGYADKTCYKPKAAKQEDKIYEWTWDNLEALINGSR